MLKALQKEPARRYASVGEFSKDLARHLQRLPVEARQPTFTYRASKFAGRHKIEIGAALLVMFAFTTAAVFAFNPFGLRDRVVAKTTGKAGPVKTKGWVFGAKSVLPVIAPAVSCDSLVNLRIPNTTVITTHSVTTGSFAPPGADVLHNLPAFCRVEGAIRPTADSDIRFEVWMPSSGWNGEFRGIWQRGPRRFY